MTLLAVGVSHQTAPVALLEQFAMGPDDRVKALHELVGSDHVSEALVLATCNRIEVFAEVERFHGGVTDVSRVLARQAGATVEELAPYVTVHYEDQAVAHLFCVAAGLDSMVVGETQVLGQLRAAYALARDEGAVGRSLHPVAQRALRVGKRVHAETGIDRAGASLVSVALDRAEDRIGSLAGRRVLVVGAGSMGALSATTLARRGAAVVVSSRTAASAERLAAAVEGRAADLAGLPGELADADVLVTCTGATGLVVHTEVVTAAMAGRPDRPLVVVDLALPRDVDPAVAGLPSAQGRRDSNSQPPVLETGALPIAPLPFGGRPHPLVRSGPVGGDASRAARSRRWTSVRARAPSEGTRRIERQRGSGAPRAADRRRWEDDRS